MKCYVVSSKPWPGLNIKLVSQAFSAGVKKQRKKKKLCSPERVVLLTFFLISKKKKPTKDYPSPVS